MPTRHRQFGFTLIEMLVVIGLIGVLSASALLAFGKPTKEAALDNSYATVITALESARNKAMQGGGNGTAGQTVTISADGSSISTETAVLPLSSTVTILESGNTIEFARISGATTPTTLTLEQSGGASRIINITAQGYVQ